MLAAESKVVSAPATNRVNSKVAVFWKQIVEPVEPFLDAVHSRLARQVDEFDAAIAPYAEYALNGNGKHLRPALVALSANSVGGTNDSHVTVAVIIEMVHLATLVHDDVMDEAAIRRSRPTLATLLMCRPPALAFARSWPQIRASMLPASSRVRKPPIE